jgi:hypothetical protein
MRRTCDTYWGGDVRGFGGQHSGNRHIGKTRRMWQDDFLNECSICRMVVLDWMDVVQDVGKWLSVVSMIMNLRVS